MLPTSSCHVDSSGEITSGFCQSNAPRNATSRDCRDDDLGIEWHSAPESYRLNQQLAKFAQRIEDKMLSYHQDMLHLAIEIREANHDCAKEISFLERRLFNHEAPFAEYGRSSALRGPLERANKVEVPKEEVGEEKNRPTTGFNRPIAVKDNEYDKSSSSSKSNGCSDKSMAADGAEKGRFASQKKGERAEASHASLDVVNEDLDDKHSEQHRQDCEPKLMTTDLVNLYDSKDTVGHHRKKSSLEIFKDYLMGTGFDMVIGLFIMANAIVMAIELEYGGSQIAPELGLPKDTEVWPAADEAFFVLNHVFCVIFLMEFILRVYSFRVKFFKSGANCVDAAIVWISVIDLYIMQPMEVVLPNIAFLRMLRIVKLLKALNIIKQLRPFRHLRVLCGAYVASRAALMWSIIFLACVHFMFAIFMTQMLHGFLREETAELEVQMQVYKYFGTVSRSLLTMWEITLTTGAWAKIGRLLIYEVDRAYTLFFVSYVYLFSFAAMKVISALFLKETLEAANNDQDMVIQARVNHNNRIVNMTRQLFHKIDSNDSGEITLDEMKAFMSNPAGAQWFYMLEIEAPELYKLFSLLDVDGHGEIDFNQFMSGVLRLQGGARSIDVVEIQSSFQSVFAEMAQVLQGTKSIAAELEEVKDSIQKLKNASSFVLE